MAASAPAPTTAAPIPPDRPRRTRTPPGRRTPRRRSPWAAYPNPWVPTDASREPKEPTRDDAARDPGLARHPHDGVAPHLRRVRLDEPREEGRGDAFGARASGAR